MVIPWVGFPLGDLLKRFEPTSQREVRRVHDAATIRRRCPGSAARCSTGRTSKGCASTRRCIRSTLLAVGLYGQALPNQNGAPLRLVVPWKYGFKGIKSIVKIRFTDDAAANTLEHRRAERVRLLRQREPAGRSSALEPGDRAAHRRGFSPRASRRCCSTATPIRSRTCTRAWICAVTSDGVARCERRAALPFSTSRWYSSPACVPLAWLLCGAFGWLGQSLGADPVKKLRARVRQDGPQLPAASRCWSPPSRQLSDLPHLLRLRRMLGLFAFFYVLLHFTVYLVLDLEFNFRTVFTDIAKRPYITIGFTGACCCSMPLAVTSTNGMMRRLGTPLAEAASPGLCDRILGVWHFYWQVKRDIREPLIYAGILASCSSIAGCGRGAAALAGAGLHRRPDLPQLRKELELQRLRQVGHSAACRRCRACSR